MNTPKASVNKTGLPVITLAALLQLGCSASDQYGNCVELPWTDCPDQHNQTSPSPSAEQEVSGNTSLDTYSLKANFGNIDSALHGLRGEIRDISNGKKITDVYFNENGVAEIRQQELNRYIERNGLTDDSVVYFESKTAEYDNFKGGIINGKLKVVEILDFGTLRQGLDSTSTTIVLNNASMVYSSAVLKRKPEYIGNEDEVYVNNILEQVGTNVSSVMGLYDKNGDRIVDHNDARMTYGNEYADLCVDDDLDYGVEVHSGPQNDIYNLEYDYIVDGGKPIQLTYEKRSDNIGKKREGEYSLDEGNTWNYFSTPDNASFIADIGTKVFTREINEDSNHINVYTVGE